MIRRGLASDNNSGVHPEVLDALIAVNQGHALGYGHDLYTRSISGKINEYLGGNADVYFVFLGTAANVLASRQVLKSYQGIICAEYAHLSTDECAAPEFISGTKLLTIPTVDGKLTPDLIRTKLSGRGDEHRVQPRIVSISNATEVGTVYSIDELKVLIEFAHSENLLVHMDGARIANAAVSVGKEIFEITSELGLDLLSLGGTKNGLMGAEMVVFFHKDPAHPNQLMEKYESQDFMFLQKQGMQLASKMRYLAAQFDAYFNHDLWKRNAQHANSMALRLYESVIDINKIQILFKPQANALFATLPQELIPKLQEKCFFYVWDESLCMVRWMCSWDTTEDDLKEFVYELRQLCCE